MTGSEVPEELQVSEELQFDRVEPASGAAPGSGSAMLTCAVGGEPLTDTYFEINGHPVCDDCRLKVEASRAGDGGSPREVRALLFGLGGGVLGAGIYFAVLKLSGYEVGLIAILVGWLVGAAVREGSGRRGGALYQLMAVVITYAAIVATYVPLMVGQIRAEAPEVAIPWLSVILYAALSPFLAGLKNILGLLVIGFGLYQAWALNRRPPFEVSGPFQVGAGGASAATSPAALPSP